MTPTAKRLNSAEFCERKEFLERDFEHESLTPIQILSKSIDHGLTVDSEDPGQSAGDQAMTLASHRTIETTETDLLGLATHIATLADLIVFILRTGEAWKKPDPLGDWIPSTYFGPYGLRRVVLVDRWDEKRETQERFDWATLEGNIYGMNMSLVVVKLGAMRNGRRHGPLSRGYLHPANGTLRFKKRDGTEFSSEWDQVYREDFPGGRDEWLQGMVEDGVLEECLEVYKIPLDDTQDAVQTIAGESLRRINDTQQLPPVKLSKCFSGYSPCPFSSCCPYHRLPSEKNGFQVLSVRPRITCNQ